MIRVSATRNNDHFHYKQVTSKSVQNGMTTSTTNMSNEEHELLLPSHKSQNDEVDDITSFPKPKNCSNETKTLVGLQLEPYFCNRFKRVPWLKFCSFTHATDCPDASWFEDQFITTISSNAQTNGGDVGKKMMTKATNSEEQQQEGTFVGISVGCNKGFDAINMIRMGTNDPVFDKTNWKKSNG